MGDLPTARTEPSRRFYHCGVYYTGHVYIKANPGRGIKTTKGYMKIWGSSGISMLYPGFQQEVCGRQP
jgi:hypothetical protein